MNAGRATPAVGFECGREGAFGFVAKGGSLEPVHKLIEAAAAATQARRRERQLILDHEALPKRRDYIEALEDFYLRLVLSRSRGSISECSRVSGDSRPNFYKRLEVHGIDQDQYRVVDGDGEDHVD